MQIKLKVEQNFWKSTILKEQNSNCINGTLFLNCFEEKSFSQINQKNTDTQDQIKKNELEQKQEESSEKMEDKIQDDFLDSQSIESSLEPINYSYMVQYQISPNEQYLVVNTKQVAFWQVSDKIIIIDLQNQKLQSFSFKTDHIGAPPTYFLADYLLVMDAQYAGKPYFILWDLINHWGENFIITYNYPINQLIYDPQLNCLFILTKQNTIVKQQFNIVNQNQEIQTVLNLQQGWPYNILDSYPLQNIHILNNSFALLVNSINQMFLIKFRTQIQVFKYYYWKSLKSEVIKLTLSNSLVIMGNNCDEISPSLIDFRRGKLIRKAKVGRTDSNLYSYQGSCFISSIQDEDNHELYKSHGLIFDILRGNLKQRKLIEQNQQQQTKFKFTHNLIVQYCNDTINYKLII